MSELLDVVDERGIPTGEVVNREEELSCVKWFDYEACVNAVRENIIPHCIYVEELEMVRAQAERSRLIGAAMEYEAETGKG